MEREGEAESQICTECGESVPVKNIKRHNLRKHDKREFICEECGTKSVGYEAHRGHKVCKLLNIFQRSCLRKTLMSWLLYLSSLGQSLFIVKLRSRSRSSHTSYTCFPTIFPALFIHSLLHTGCPKKKFPMF